jgi:hypothetical protein
LLTTLAKIVHVRLNSFTTIDKNQQLIDIFSLLSDYSFQFIITAFICLIHFFIALFNITKTKYSMKAFKKTINTISLLLLCYTTFSQNLVPNPSFEDTLYCPWGTNQIDASIGWMNFGNSPDYYNTCSPAGLNVPNSQFGFQYAHSGNGIAGIVTWLNPSNDPAQVNYREYVGSELMSQLTTGQKYYFSFFTNYSGYVNPTYRQVASNKIGLRFTTEAYSMSNKPPLNNFAHLSTDSILNDTVTWIKLSGSFIADSAYNYLAIGNFFDDNNTDTSSFGGQPFGGMAAYYYIDDICVSTDSLYNEVWTGLTTHTTSSKPNKEIFIYPNPSFDVVNISTQEAIENIELINSIGQVVYTQQVKNNFHIQLNITEIPKGLYMARVKTKNNLYTSLININH